MLRRGCGWARRRGEEFRSLAVGLEGDVGVALKVPSREGTTVAQEVEVDCRSVVAAARAVVVVVVW